MDLKVGDIVLTNDDYDSFFGCSRSGIIKCIQHNKYITIKCDDNIIRVIHVDWLKKIDGD